MDASSKDSKAEKEIVVTMPSSQILSDRLKAKGFGYFMEKTGIHKELADKERCPEGVVMQVGQSMYDFACNTNNPTQAEIMQQSTDAIIKILLQDSPEAIEHLKATKFLKS